ncbi:MAG: hypothetical protein ABI364_09535 [Caldimonas sp.]
MSTLRGLLLAVALASATAATAQTIYRCGNAYSAEPCARATVVAVGVEPTAGERAEAERVAARTKRLATDMARDRRAEEAAIRPALATSLGPSPPPAPEAKANGKKPVKKRARRAGPADGGDFVATVPKPKKPKT